VAPSQTKFAGIESDDRAESRRSADSHVRAVSPKTCGARGQGCPRSFYTLLEWALVGGKDTAFHFGKLDPACGQLADCNFPSIAQYITMVVEPITHIRRDEHGVA